MTVCGSRFIGQQWMKFVKRTLLRAGRATVHSSLHHRFRCQESLIRLTWAYLRFQGAQTDTRILPLLLSNSTSRTFEILWYRSISPLTTFKTSLNPDTSINKTTRDNSNLSSGHGLPSIVLDSRLKKSCDIKKTLVRLKPCKTSALFTITIIEVNGWILYLN